MRARSTWGLPAPPHAATMSVITPDAQHPGLNAQEAFALNKAAVSRDYYVEPRIGK